MNKNVLLKHQIIQLNGPVLHLQSSMLFNKQRQCNGGKVLWQAQCVVISHNTHTVLYHRCGRELLSKEFYFQKAVREK